MPQDQFLIDLINRLPFILFKFFAIALLILHFFFSVIIVRQVSIMTRIVEARISSSIYLISISHLLASLFVLIWAIIFL